MIVVYRAVFDLVAKYRFLMDRFIFQIVSRETIVIFLWIFYCVFGKMRFSSCLQHVYQVK